MKRKGNESGDEETIIGVIAVPLKIKLLNLLTAVCMFLPLIAMFLFAFDEIRFFAYPADTIYACLTLSGVLIALAGGVIPVIGMLPVYSKLDLHFITYKKPGKTGVFSIYSAPTVDTVRKYPLIAAAALILFIIGAPLVLYGASKYYYFTPSQIVIGDGWGNGKKMYSWSDITQVKEECSRDRRRGDLDVWFDAILRDGNYFTVNYHPEDVAVLEFVKKKWATNNHIAYSYHTDSPSKCPGEFFYPTKNDL